MVESSKLEEIKELAARLLCVLGIEARLEAVENPPGAFAIKLSGENLGILIGRYGETLLNLETVLRLMVWRALGEGLTVTVDVGGYRKEREGRLLGMSQRAADKVRFLQTPVALPPMSSYERRLIHVALSEEKGICTESSGEGYERRVVVKPV